ncbi:hypothetical protein ACFXDE_23885 [Kitasatospora sp. NPDC059408]|uniref:hypothetical protein n=1 Tax=Kitasatospora sp. NPDC059408 TaxID=3346823 RepID=UPI0036BE354F
MRSGWLLGLDGDAARVAGLGLVRLAADEWAGGPDGAAEGSTGAAAWLWHVRAASFADTWLAYGESPAPGLRVPAGAVLESLARRAAELVLRARRDDGPAALEWLGLWSAEARERAHWADTAHPSEPAALVLVWHGVQAITAEDPEDRDAHGRHITERCEAYVRERHRRQDTLALLLSCARIAATALVELGDGDPARAGRWLEDLADRTVPHDGPAPLWVPGRPSQTAG